MARRLLILNLGSTSTKLALFHGLEAAWQETLHHPAAEVRGFLRIIDQEGYRRERIEQALDRAPRQGFDAVVARGGVLRPLRGGVYAVNGRMLADLRAARFGEHPSNLSAIIGAALAERANVPVFVADPPTVDELQDVARLSGLPGIERAAAFHALNQRAVGRRAAARLGRDYQEVNLVVAHLGGGISVAAHQLGRIVDVNNALRGEGPFTPERAGGLPAMDVADLCFSGRYSRDEVMKLIAGRGGITAYLGTNDVRQVLGKALTGDAQADMVLAVMGYQVAKEIGACAAVLCGAVDAVALTGSLAHSERIAADITRRVSFIAPALVFPGEDEMLALAEGGLRALSGAEPVQVY